MRGKLSLLLLGLFLSIGSFAQSFTPSFEKEFLAQMFAQCPDSLKEDFLKMETSYSTYKFKEIRSIEQMKKFIRRSIKIIPKLSDILPMRSMHMFDTATGNQICGLIFIMLTGKIL